MSKPVRFGIIGCGEVGQSLSGTDAYHGIGEWHARYITELENATLVAVADIEERNAKALAGKFGVKAYFPDYQALLDRDDVDVVNICTPSGTHGQIAVAAAHAGKHVIVEKPMEVTVEKADAMMAACKRAGVKLAVVFPFRHGEGMKTVKAALERDVFGKIILSNALCRRYRGQDYYSKSGWRGTWALDGGGACMNQGVHIIDSYLHLLGPVSRVYARMGTLGHPGAEVEDTATALLAFQDAGLGVIEATTCAYPDFGDRIDLHGEEGSVVLSGLPPKIVEWKVVNDSERIDIADIDEAIDPANPYCLHKNVIRDMIDAIRKDRDPVIGGAEGRKSLEVIEAIYRSARQGREVVLADAVDTGQEADSEDRANPG